MEDLQEANHKLKKKDKKIKRIEEALDIKEDENLTLNKEIDSLKEQIERSDIMVEQLKHEHNEMMEAAAKEKMNTKKQLGNQKEEMKKMMDEQLRQARDEAEEKA